MDYSIKIGGEAGQGIQTIGSTLARYFSRAGCHVFTHQDYESRVRGGHNFFQIRISERPVAASRDVIDILVALDSDSLLIHEQELSKDGRIIYDSSALKQKREKPRFLDIPFIDLAIEHGSSRIMANVVAIGAVLGMLGADPDILIKIIEQTFRKKGEEVIKGNISAARAGYDFADKNCAECGFSLKGSGADPYMLISGNEAVGLGAISSGCKFYAAYPMTPSTGIMNYIAARGKDYEIVVEQAEDEIAAINMALGASFAGVRAMTGTSGGGFALMTEGLSLASITETPIVIALAQRPGPATGLPTRTEQADLQFAIYTSHGEFPRVILAPGTPEQAFYLTNRAFDIAERFQIPVIIMTDQYLADSQWTFEGFDPDKVKYTDYRLRGDAFKNLSEYRRHAFTDTGITPLGVPGDARHLVVTDSDEHDEEGHLIEDAETRIKMVDKRLFRKMPLIQHEIAPPVLYGSDRPDIVLAGWGSTYGIMKEAVDALSGGRKTAMLHFSELYPFPLTDKFDYLEIMNNAKLSVCVENNATGQFARLVRTETGFDFALKINKYDGRPFKADSLLNELHDHIKGL
ncbi:2-oxoglutarate oxidoreductase subunit KorA [bacterium BMS3Abin10]|nr:2-oxoglutarate oxidoreductase subunit KorA [bacterium BMS3Abin10]GBE38217.1 2-oxoglutarate oxidoreductase subunit KorA [bacterium BMS3Bbin08]HDH49837.1 2-oxoacid:acceptor oxidoreductase subunit alpha [Nitrospirota bacterium]HDK17485.1 2-oxoacid:acceptor oxidoreductase subunit alpha [Nitrospirota bacterium]